MMVSRLGRWWDRHGVSIHLSLAVSKHDIPREVGEQIVVDQSTHTRDEYGMMPEGTTESGRDRKQREKREMSRVLDDVNLSLAILKRDAELMTGGRLSHD